jgi:hypothetical protein
VSQQEISDYCHTFELKIASFLQPVTKITDEEFGKLGHKDPDVYPLKYSNVGRIDPLPYTAGCETAGLTRSVNPS